MGLDNFCDLFTDEMFLLAVKNTLWHMIVTVPMPSLGAMILVAVIQNVAKGVRFPSFPSFVR